MPKAIEDFIDGKTFRAIKGLSLPEMNSYLYNLYAAGYAAGLSDAGGEKLREVIDQLSAKLETVINENRKEKDAP